jgi:isopropylmalate/homocitrate/citramalate synthase
MEWVTKSARFPNLDRLKKLGYTLSSQDLNPAYQRFLAVADKKQEVFDEDLLAILPVTVFQQTHPAGPGLSSNGLSCIQEGFAG